MQTHTGVKGFAVGSVLLACGLAAGAAHASERWYCSYVGDTDSYGNEFDPAYAVAWGAYDEYSACQRAKNLLYSSFYLEPDYSTYYSGYYDSYDWITVALDCDYPDEYTEWFSGYGDDAFRQASNYQGGHRAACWYYIAVPQ